MIEGAIFSRSIIIHNRAYRLLNQEETVIALDDLDTIEWM